MILAEDTRTSSVLMQHYDIHTPMQSHNSDRDTAPTFKNMEDGAETLNREELGLQASRLEKFIKGLQGALVRIENKTYGICRVTGKLIPKERLRAVPHATLSVEAKEKRR